MFGLSTIGIALHWWMVGSYHAGEFLVSSSISALKVSRVVVVTLYEDSAVWLRDVLDFVSGFRDVVSSVFDQLLWIARWLTAITGNAVYSILHQACYVTHVTRELFILVGSGCSFLASLPILFVNHVLDMLARLLEELCNLFEYSVDRLTECATNPRALHALLGLAASICVVAAALRRTHLQLRYSTTKAILQRWKRKAWRQGKKVLTFTWKRGTVATTGIDKGYEASDVCTVCLDGTRSICLLPCRHLCLCKACIQALPAPLRCPLCRQLVNDAIQVYF